MVKRGHRMEHKVTSSSRPASRGRAEWGSRAVRTRLPVQPTFPAHRAAAPGAHESRANKTSYSACCFLMKRHLSESMLLYIHCSNQEIINLTCVPKQSFLVSRHRTLTVSVSNEMLLWSRKKLLTRSSVFKAAKTLLFWPHHCTCHSDLYNDCKNCTATGRKYQSAC